MIYLLEDDESIRNFVSYALNNSGMETESFGRPSEFWAGLSRAVPQLVLLDIMLPEEDGLEVLRKLRARPDTQDVPVILLTARSTEYDKVIGLDAGADDYVAKPFGMMELLARVRARLRRTSDTAPKEYRIGDLTVCPDRHLVYAAGQEVSLTYKEFELLCLLLSAGGAVLTRDRILQQIWGFSFDGESRTVDVHIRTLRTKLGSCGDLIETVRGVGYKIAQPTREKERS